MRLRSAFDTPNWNRSLRVVVTTGRWKLTASAPAAFGSA
jgi:hypothetical protein